MKTERERERNAKISTSAYIYNNNTQNLSLFKRSREEKERERDLRDSVVGFERVVVLSRDGAELLSVSSPSSSLFQSANEERNQRADSQIREKKRSLFYSGTFRIGSRSDEQQQRAVVSFWGNAGHQRAFFVDR